MIKQEGNMTYLYDETPAERFGEAYPIGNGQIGAMVYGSVPENKILLSENTFFSGAPYQDNCKQDAAHSFYKMRRAALNGDYKKVHEYAEGFIGRKNDYGTNLPVGNLMIDYGCGRYPVTLSYRKLRIDCGIAERKIVLSDDRNTEIKEEVFTSNRKKCLVHSAESSVAFDCSIRLTELTHGKIGQKQVGDQSAVIEFDANAYELMHCENETGVHLYGRLHIYSDGVLEAEKEGVLIKNCTWVHSYLFMKTDYLERAGYLSPGREAADMDKSRKIEAEITTRYQHSNHEMSRIRSEHSKDFRKSMNACQLEIMKQEEISFLFQYGRYLLLSSARKDSVLPPHLQGIWNDNVACRIGWTCDMHLDINTQMNYWPALGTGMEETMEPLFFWIEKILVPEGRKTAASCYGIQGWVGEIVSNAWGYAAPYWASPISPCPTGGVWILTHLWEYYLYTENTELLTHKIYPLYQEAVSFFKEYLFLNKEGIFLSGPSVSPENSFRSGDKLYQISIAPTYEIIMIRELLMGYLKMCDILIEQGLIPENDQISMERTHINDILGRLPEYRILEDGTLAEYYDDLDVPDRQHRHTSHLLGLFPFHQISAESTPKLAKAVERTIDSKITPLEQWENTGWASSLLALYQARLCNGNQAEYHLKSMCTVLKEPNYMIYHPPTRGADAFDHVYELDGNTGFTSAVLEMLLQSHEDVICILPALPDAWEEGQVEGLCAKGGIKVSIRWDKNGTRQVILISEKAKTVMVKYREELIRVSLVPGEKKELQF